MQSNDEQDGGTTKKLSGVAALAAAISTLAVTIIGSAASSYFQGRANLRLEEKKFESALILKTLETDSKENKLKQLSLLVDLGFLDDRDERISSLLEKPERLPSPRGNTLTTNADFSLYCLETFGESFTPSDDNMLFCENGEVQKEIDIEEVCFSQFGSRDYTFNPGSMLILCNK